MRAKRVQFGSLMFLAESPRQLVKRRRLRDILLMSLRAFLLVLLALAFARPFIPPELVPFVDRKANESVVLLLDTSYSMGAIASATTSVGPAAGNDDSTNPETNSRGRTVFDHARQDLLDRLDAAADGDEVALLAFSDAPEIIVNLTRDKGLVRSALNTIAEPTSRTTNFYEALRLADEVLQDARHEQREVVLFSDMQQQGWSGSIENWKLPPGIRFEPVAVSAVSGSNAYVDEFAINMRGAVPHDAGVSVRLDARVRTAADDSAQPNPAENSAVLKIGALATDSRNIPASPSANVSFQRRIDQTGMYSGTLTLNDDVLAVDNVRHFSFAVTQQPSVLSIDGGARSSFRESFFLEKAFDLGSNSLFAFESGNPGNLNRRTLDGRTIVFVANLSSVPNGAAEAIRSLAESGGVVVVSFGDRASIPGYSSLFASLGIGRVERVVVPASSQGEEAIIGDVDWRHPVFSALQGAAGGILRPKFRRYAELVPDSSSTILASFDSGDPWIVERRIGRGSVIVTAATLGAEWTDFPINELFVPFVYQLARYASNLDGERLDYTVGEPIALTGVAGERWEIRNPRGDVFPVDLETSTPTSGSMAIGYFRETDFPGLYTAVSGSRRLVFAVNVDPAESDLTSRDVNEVFASVVSPSSDIVDTPASTTDLIEAEESNQKLWRLLLGLALLLFLLESFLANKPRLQKAGSGKLA